MKTIRLTTAQAIVKWLLAQRTRIDGEDVPIFAGVFAIFGHGNVTSLGEALEPVQDELPTYRGQNEQSMALAAVAYGKAMRGRRIMIATSSIGPGSTNMVTAAAVAHANRLPVLLFSGDTFQHRIVDPVLQQVEHFGDPTLTVTDAFKPVSRYWDRITKPAQIVRSLPQALAVMLDPATRGPAFFALPQDVQAEAYDFPERFFEPKVHYIRRPGPDPRDVEAAAALIARAQRPLIVAGGGVHYSGAVDTLALLRGAARDPGRRDGRRQVDAHPRPPELRRPDRRHRVDRGERRRRAGRRRHRGGDATPGLHDGLLVGVRESRTSGSWRSTRPRGTPTSRARSRSSATPRCPSRRSMPRSARTRRRPSGSRRPTSASPNGTPTSTRGPGERMTARRPMPRSSRRSIRPPNPRTTSSRRPVDCRAS